MKPFRRFLTALALVACVTRPASASFHEMQIEQVLGGVDGSTTVQAVQLRMRIGLQGLVSNARLVAHDAAGGNPVLLIAFPSNVANSNPGDRVLVATSNFSSLTMPSVVPDFVFTNQIPDSDLAAGSLTYEDNFGDVLWRLSWGGSSYTGPNTGILTNDADGNFGPPSPAALPSTTQQALQFQFAASALSTNNANDYAVTAGAATFTNNARTSGVVQTLVGVGDEGTGGRLALSAPVPNPVQTTMAYSVTLPKESRVRVEIFDLAGRRVRTLEDRTMPAGRNSFSWDARNLGGPVLSSGVYFLGLTTQGTRTTRRFILLR